MWGEGRWSPGSVLGFSCISDTFYDNLKATDLVYFISWMKTLRGYTPPPQFLLSVERIAKLILKKSVVHGGGVILL
jgi:hypothetical protein